MLHTIENNNLICTIDSNGAEIRSLIDKSSGEEVIWQMDETIWGSSSPVLFPAIGKIRANKIIFNGEDFAMTKHGIVRHNDNLVFRQYGISKCAFTLFSSDETLLKYPYRFSFTINYSLVENRLLMEYVIENLDDIPMQFACGGHTAYACPFFENISLTDYIIEFPKKVSLKASTLGATGLLSEVKRSILDNEQFLQLSNDVFNEDALIFENIDFDWVRLRRKDKPNGIIVKFKGYPNLAIWSKPDADFVCIEPWLGLPDSENEPIDITEKTTYQTLQPNDKFYIVIETVVE